MTDLKELFEIFAKLKVVEEKIERINKDLSRIPDVLKKLETELESKKGGYHIAKEQVEKTEKEIRSLESDIKDKEDKISKAESKMMEVKTNVEYQAAIRENEIKKEEKAKVEERALDLMALLDEKKRIFKEKESEFKQIEKIFFEDKAQLEKEQKQLKDKLQLEKSHCQTVSQSLPKESLNLYEKSKVACGGVPIAEISVGMCTACRIKLRSQLYNEILGFKALHRCPSCHRILISSPKDDQNAQSDSSL